MGKVRNMDERPRFITRTPVFLLTVMALLLAAIFGVGLAQRNAGASDPAETIQTDLLNHNPNDGKDNCPNDGNAGRGDDNKGPNGGCKSHPPHGEYGEAGNNGNNGGSNGNSGRGRGNR